jgi:hypothetical protein
MNAATSLDDCFQAEIVARRDRIIRTIVSAAQRDRAMSPAERGRLVRPGSEIGESAVYEEHGCSVALILVSEPRSIRVDDRHGATS